MAAAALFAACKAGDAACVRAELARPGAAALVNAKDVAYVRAPPALCQSAALSRPVCAVWVDAAALRRCRRPR